MKVPALDLRYSARPGRTDPMVPSPARVLQVDKETHDTFTLTLESKNGNGHPSFAPGQFSMLYVFGVGELPISISGDPEEPGRLVYTVRSVGKATNALVTREPGDTLGVRGPVRDQLADDRGARQGRPGGGRRHRPGAACGRPSIHILRHRGDYRRLIVLYGARSPRDLLYRKQLAAWAYLPDTQVLTTVDYGGLSWRGYVGVVTTLFRYVRLQPDRTVALICGPEIMMRYVIRELEARGRLLPDVPSVDGAQHEVRHRLLRPLPVRALFRLQGRSGLPATAACSRGLEKYEL